MPCTRSRGLAPLRWWRSFGPGRRLWCGGAAGGGVASINATQSVAEAHARRTAVRRPPQSGDGVRAPCRYLESRMCCVVRPGPGGGALGAVHMCIVTLRVSLSSRAIAREATHATGVYVLGSISISARSQSHPLPLTWVSGLGSRSSSEGWVSGLGAPARAGSRVSGSGDRRRPDFGV